MSSISSIYSSKSAVETLIQSTLATERQPVKDYETQKTDLNKRLAIYSDLKSKLTALRDRVKSYSSATDSPFTSQRSATSSDTSVFTATAGSTALSGIHTLFVERLASRDTLISKQYSDVSTSTALAADFNGTTQQFKINTGSGDPVELAIAFTDPNETDESVLKRIRDAINGAGLKLNASYTKDTPTSARLTISGTEYGSENAITVENVGSSTLMRELNYVDRQGNRIQYSDKTGGGYLQVDMSNLDAKFTFDGISMLRGSNTISDVISGVTFTLASVQKTGEAAETLTIGTDTGMLRKEIESFIKDFNDAIKYITEKSKINSETYERGPLSGDFAITNLRYELRNAVSRSVTGLEPGTYNMLASIGIDLSRDGEMSIVNGDKLEKALSESSSEVIDMFVSPNGVAKKLESLLNRFAGTSGVIERSKRGINSKISYIDKQIKSYEERLTIREQSLRNEYTNLQKTLSALNSQQSMLSDSMLSGITYSIS